MPFDLESLKKELQPGALKERAKTLNDRYTSPSSAQTGYSAHSAARPGPSAARKAPPPLPPSAARRTDSAGGYAAQPSPSHVPSLPQRDNSFNPPQHASNSDVGSTIDWTNLSRQDKDQFFTLLDGFFGTRQHVSSALHPDSNADLLAPPVAPTPKMTQRDVSSRDDQAPPPPPLWARPSSSSSASPAATPPSKHARDLNTMSYPTPCQTTSHAHDNANYFSSAQRWRDPWFTSDNPLPPDLHGRSDMTWTSSWRQLGNKKTLIGSALFSDLSVLWWKVEWDISQEHRPAFVSQVQKQARYLDRPEPFQAEELWYACSTYGEQVALFAEQAERAGLPIGHGECWDLASEALASVRDLPPPVPSISRTHGHLIYSGTANGKDPKKDQKGRWRGGDTNVRRGDIVEWRKVRVRKMDGRSWSDLGNPDHTAVIVNTYLSSDPSANTQPVDGDSISPWEVGTLEVIEQSQGKVPKRAEYDLTGMESGEIWIYRPVAMQDYVGIDQLKADWDQQSSRGVVQYVV